MSHSQAKHLVEILRGESNYSIWSYRTRNQLIDADVFDLGDQPADEGAELKIWIKNNNKAINIITMTIDNNVLKHVMRFNTATDMWNALSDRYNRKDTFSEIALRRTLYTSKKKNRSISDFIAEIRQTVQKLDSINKPEDHIKDKELICIILNGLPDEYSSIISFADSAQSLTVDSLEHRLLTEEQRLQHRDHHHPTNTASSSRRNFHSGKPKKAKIQPEETKKEKFCKYHRTPAHDDSECYRHRKKANAISTGTTIIDSGATTSCFSDKAAFSSYIESHDHITLADGETKLESPGTGTIRLGNSDVHIQNALHVPDIDSNLLAVSDLVDSNYTVHFDSRFCEIHDADGHVLMKIPRVDRLWVNSFKSSANSILHKRFGHLSEDQLRSLVKGQLVTGLRPEEVQECFPCAAANQKRKKFGKRTSVRASNPLEIIHSDLWGPLKFDGQGFSYFASFIDDASRFSFVTFLHNKSDFLDAFVKYRNLVENHHTSKIKKIICDNGGEYTSRRLRDLCDESGIVLQYVPPYTPELNGVAESLNRVLLVKARALMAQANLPPEFWPYAVRTANYLRNLSPTEKLDTTPYELWYGKRPNVQHLRTWGCLAFVKKEGTHVGNKIDPKSTPMVFLGYEQEDQGYIVYDTVSKRAYVRRNVKFDEKQFPKIDDLSKDNSILADYLIQTPPPQPPFPDIEHHDDPIPLAIDEHPLPILDIVEEPLPEQELIPLEPKKSVGRQMLEISQGKTQLAERQRNPPKRLGHIHLVHAARLEPKSHKDALKSSESTHWIDAESEELKSHSENQTWELAPLPPGKHTIASKWVYAYKYDQNGDVNRYKARLVAVGCSQKHGSDYTETFAPVVRWETIRLLFSIALHKQWIIDQLDVTTAFLYGTIDHEIYMKQPPGHESKDHPNWVCKLNKSIYGLKQSPRIWNAKLTDTLKSYGLIQSQLDPCLFYSPNHDLLVADFVDDILVLGTTDQRESLKRNLSTNFKMKDQGPISHYLNVVVKRKENSFLVSQAPYIHKILEKFNMTEAAPSPLPMQPNQYDVTPSPLGPNMPYRQLIGALIYLSSTTRPDISYVSGFLARQVEQPTTFHWDLAKQTLRYLKGTINQSLEFTDSENQSLTAYVDADYGGDRIQRKSTTGYVVFHGNNLISWNSKLQPIIATSTMEAEYVALSSVVKEIMYLRNLLAEIGFPQHGPSTVNEDNQACIKLASNTGQFYPRSKHIDLRYHHSRKAVEDKIIKLNFCPTSNMLADVLTKALPKESFNSLTSCIRAFRSGE